MAVGRSNLCDLCRQFDCQALLLAAESSPSQTRTGHAGVEHDAVHQFFRHQPSIEALKASVSHCSLCAEIWNQCCRHRRPFELTTRDTAGGIIDGQIFLGTQAWDTGVFKTPHIVAVQYGPPPHNVQRQLASFEACVEHGTSVPHSHLLARLQASSAADPVCFDLARRWLKECREDHVACRRASNAKLSWPTRIIDVRPENSLIDSVRLVSGGQCSGDYTALSYCWGGERALLLTHESHASFTSRILLPDMPATFRHAVTVTRELGISYLWIDAVCIFQDFERQDSREDWARESGRMRDVYRGAVLTIEAASANKVSEGFLTPRKSSQPYCRLPWGPSTESACVKLRPSLDITDSQLLSAKVYTRGWVMQERLLAPRTLSFGTQQMSMDCPTGFLDESGRSTELPRVTETYLSKRSMSQLRNDNFFLMRTARKLLRYLGLPTVMHLWTPLWFNLTWSSQGVIYAPANNWLTYYDYWRELVQRFSRRQLTSMCDKLPAMSGLADEFRRATNDDYVAGMWRGDLVLSLAWMTSELEKLDDPESVRSIAPGDWPAGIKAAEYIAPSWSWASVRGIIRFPGQQVQDDTRYTYHARVKQAQLSPKNGGDANGALLDARLVLCAPSLDVPDPRRPCAPECVLPKLHSEVRRHVFLTANRASEFYQHHEDCDDQRFALMKLLVKHSSTTQGLLFTLLIESTSGEDWRRLCCLDILLTTIEDLTADYWVYSDADNEETKSYFAKKKVWDMEIAALAEEVEQAEWSYRTVTLR